MEGSSLLPSLPALTRRLSNRAQKGGCSHFRIRSSESKKARLGDPILDPQLYSSWCVVLTRRATKRGLFLEGVGARLFTSQARFGGDASLPCATDRPVPRQDASMSIDHNEFERELRRSSSGFMSPTAFLRRRAAQGQQRRPLGKLLDNVIARSSSAIELIKSPLKGRGALRISNAIEILKSPMKGKQSQKDAPVRLLPAVSAASQPHLITPSCRTRASQTWPCSPKPFSR